MGKKNNSTRRRAIDQVIDDFRSGIYMQPGKMRRGDGCLGLFTSIPVAFNRPEPGRWGLYDGDDD